MTTALPQRITISPDALLQEIDGEAIILDLKREHYYGLDDVGLRMWQLLVEEHDVEAAVNRIVAEYEIDADTVRNDLQILITNLVNIGLIRVEDNPEINPAIKS